MADWKRRLVHLFLDALVAHRDSVVEVLCSLYHEVIASAEFCRLEGILLQSRLNRLMESNDGERIERFIDLAPRCAGVVSAICDRFRYTGTVTVTLGVRVLRAALRHDWFTPTRDESILVVQWLTDQDPLEAVADVFLSVLDDRRFDLEPIDYLPGVFATVLEREENKRAPDAFIVKHLKSRVRV